MPLRRRLRAGPRRGRIGSTVPLFGPLPSSPVEIVTIKSFERSSRALGGLDVSNCGEIRPRLGRLGTPVAAGAPKSSVGRNVTCEVELVSRPKTSPETALNGRRVNMQRKGTFPSLEEPEVSTVGAIHPVSRSLFPPPGQPRNVPGEIAKRVRYVIARKAQRRQRQGGAGLGGCAL